MITDADVFERYPDIRITRDNIEHFRGLLNHQLVFNRCQICGYWIYPHRPMCPECWSTNVLPTEVSGQGRVYMFTLLHQGGVDGVLGYDFQFPHLTGAIELDEQTGLRYHAPIVNCEYEDVSHDMPVELTWLDREGYPVVAFQPSQPHSRDIEGK
jgi:uncharacterized OB-fold protein